MQILCYKMRQQYGYGNYRCYPVTSKIKKFQNQVWYPVWECFYHKVPQIHERFQSLDDEEKFSYISTYCNPRCLTWFDEFMHRPFEKRYVNVIFYKLCAGYIPKQNLSIYICIVITIDILKTYPMYTWTWLATHMCAESSWGQGYYCEHFGCHYDCFVATNGLPLCHHYILECGCWVLDCRRDCLSRCTYGHVHVYPYVLHIMNACGFLCIWKYLRVNISLILVTWAYVIYCY